MTPSISASDVRRKISTGNRALNRAALALLLSACGPWADRSARAQDDGPSWEQRAGALEERLGSAGGSAEQYRELLDALYRLDTPKRALAAARRAVAQHGHHAAVRGRVGRAYFRAGLLEETSKLLAGNPRTAEPAAALVLSKLMFADGRSEVALRVALKGLETDPEDPELHYQVAMLQGRQQRHELAARHYELADRFAARGSGYPLALIGRRCAGRAALHRALGESKANLLQTVGSAAFALPRQLPLPTLQVSVNGGPAVGMLLDLSGGAALSLDDDAARSVGLEAVSEASVADLTGRITATRWAVAGSLQIGECRMQRVLTQIYDFEGDNLPGIQGVLGAGLFASHRLQLDFAASALRIVPSKTETFESSQGRRLVLPTPFLGGDQPLFPLRVGDKKANAMIDIGWPMTCFSSELLASLKEPADIRNQQVGGLAAQISGGIPYRIGGRTISPSGSIAFPFISGEASSTLGLRIDALIGWDVFQQMKSFSLDYPARVVIIEWK